jgi:hypothetical protein
MNNDVSAAASMTVVEARRAAARAGFTCWRGRPWTVTALRLQLRQRRLDGFLRNSRGKLEEVKTCVSFDRLLDAL